MPVNLPLCIKPKRLSHIHVISCINLFSIKHKVVSVFPRDSFVQFSEKYIPNRKSEIINRKSS